MEREVTGKFLIGLVIAFSIFVYFGTTKLVRLETKNNSREIEYQMAVQRNSKS